MKDGRFNFLPPLLAGLALVVFAAVFGIEMGSFRRAVIGWATRDLASRTELAAANLREALGSGDFRRIHAFGENCRAQNLRLTIFSHSGRGLVYDSVRPDEDPPDCLYEMRTVGACDVRLGLPLDRVLDPFRRARVGFLLAGLLGGACVLLVLLSTYRQHVRMRALARLEAFRREFIADVSHDIKTPLTGILGAADLLSGDPPAPVRQKLLAMVKRESVRLNDLAQNVLSLARLERDGFAPACANVNLEDLVNETLDGLRARANAANVALVASVSPGAAAFCDSQLISRALSNLIENAIRHSGSRDVVVSARNADGAAELAVEDHGVGIPPEHAARVFERFYRVDSARTAEAGGAGLGLAIVRRIARLHGGDVSLNPVRPSGCRFTIRIPKGAS